MTRKKELMTLIARFDFCRCTKHCQREQYADEAMQDKPGGRYSVCEIEAGDHDITVPQPDDEASEP